jgi:hypothetical protein
VSEDANTLPNTNHGLPYWRAFVTTALRVSFVELLDAKQDCLLTDRLVESNLRLIIRSDENVMRRSTAIPPAAGF